MQRELEPSKLECFQAQEGVRVGNPFVNCRDAADDVYCRVNGQSTIVNCEMTRFGSRLRMHGSLSSLRDFEKIC